MENTENTNKITTESIKNLSHVLSHVCQKIGFRVPKYFCNLFIYCSLQNSTKSNWKIQYFLHREIAYAVPRSIRCLSSRIISEVTVMHTFS